MTLITDDFKPPDVIIHPVSEIKPGTDVEVLVEANDISGLKWVRLRYRHVTQFEDYLTSEMEYDPVRKAYKAHIPGDFIVPEWYLMFFVEVLDNKGNGRMYPDFEKDQPYVNVEPVRNNQDFLIFSC